MNDATQTKKFWLWAILIIVGTAAVVGFWYMNRQQGTIPDQALTTPSPAPADDLGQIEDEAKDLSIENPDAELGNIEKELGL